MVVAWAAWLGLVCALLILVTLAVFLFLWFREEWDDEGWDKR
jgi:hypothetical protein